MVHVILAYVAGTPRVERRRAVARRDAEEWLATCQLAARPCMQSLNPAHRKERSQWVLGVAIERTMELYAGATEVAEASCRGDACLRGARRDLEGVADT